MSDIAVVVRHSSGRSINVLVQREGRNAPVPLSLTPQPWSGEGLIGCKITPLENVERWICHTNYFSPGYTDNIYIKLYKIKQLS